ncbi:MAG TPA: hypothetical protein PLG60_01495 [Acidimicrobiales bacterium]|nr:MAG: hypothetical protein B7X07_04355 [Actinobacteria bacterium 21-64-8]HQT99157.1 hypothetical protein [Acidimicrobiales bacterium]
MALETVDREERLATLAEGGCVERIVVVVVVVVARGEVDVGTVTRASRCVTVCGVVERSIGREGVFAD